jgi:hypothetical protein
MAPWLGRTVEFNILGTSTPETTMRPRPKFLHTPPPPLAGADPAEPVRAAAPAVDLGLQRRRRAGRARAPRAAGPLRRPRALDCRGRRVFCMENRA